MEKRQFTKGEYFAVSFLFFARFLFFGSFDLVGAVTGDVPVGFPFILRLILIAVFSVLAGVATGRISNLSQNDMSLFAALLVCNPEPVSLFGNSPCLLCGIMMLVYTILITGKNGTVKFPAAAAFIFISAAVSANSLFGVIPVIIALYFLTQSNEIKPAHVIISVFAAALGTAVHRLLMTVVPAEKSLFIDRFVYSGFDFGSVLHSGILKYIAIIASAAFVVYYICFHSKEKKQARISGMRKKHNQGGLSSGAVTAVSAICLLLAAAGELLAGFNGGIITVLVVILAALYERGDSAVAPAASECNGFARRHILIVIAAVILIPVLSFVYADKTPLKTIANYYFF